jgi:hypothetical protein
MTKNANVIISKHVFRFSFCANRVLVSDFNAVLTFKLLRYGNQKIEFRRS